MKEGACSQPVREAWWARQARLGAPDSPRNLLNTRKSHQTSLWPMCARFSTTGRELGRRGCCCWCGQQARGGARAARAA